MFFPDHTKVLFLFTATGLLLTAAIAGAGQEVVTDGVLHIVNGSEPADGRQVVQLEEVWRVGGEDSEDFFGLVSQLVVDDEGNVYLLDTRLAEVPVYSPDGERLKTLSREGEGPGETHMPTNLMFMPDGTLGLLQAFPGRVTKVDLEGNPAGVIEFGDKTSGGFLSCFDIYPQGENVVVAGQETVQMPPSGRKQISFVAAYDLQGQELKRYVEYTREVDFTRFVFDEDNRNEIEFRRSTVGRDGRVYVAAYRNQYRIDVYAPDGALERVIERDYDHLQREDAEYQRIKTRLESRLARLPNPEIKISATEPDISAIRLGYDGNLWVETSRGGRDQPEGIFYTWDVFSPDGHFLRQVAAACPGDGTNDMMLWVDGAAVQVTGFMDAVQALQGGGGASEEDEDEEAAPMEVIYYRFAG